MSNDHDMISPFEENKLEVVAFHMVYHLLGMMLEYQMNLKYLIMLIPKLLIQNFKPFNFVTKNVRMYYST